MYSDGYLRSKSNLNYVRTALKGRYIREDSQNERSRQRDLYINKAFLVVGTIPSRKV